MPSDICVIFTDVVGLDQETGQEYSSKTPSTSGSPEAGIFDALQVYSICPEIDRGHLARCRRGDQGPP